jgi:glycosyltransferase involved in cell wall biosynthesis
MDVGGLERNVVNQVREGCPLGQEVAVICLERPGTLAPEVERHGGRVVSVGKRPGIDLAAAVRLRAALRQLRPDVVHSHQIASLFYSGLAAAGTEALVVHTEHGKERYAQRLRTRLLGRLAGRFAARFYCLSEDMAAEVVARRIVPRRKVFVIGNGIDAGRFRPRGQREALRRSLGIPADAVVVGTVGRLNEVKRQDLLLRGFARLREKLPSAHLLLIGDGPLMQDLCGQAAGLGLGGCVHFLGYQPEPERYYEAMDVFALTSRSEGIPQALLEASAAGVPAVAARVGGVPEVIDDGRTGLLFPSGDEAALAAGLYALAADAELGRRLSAAARDRVETRFHVRRMAADYHRHFLELLGREGPHAGGVGGPGAVEPGAGDGPGSPGRGRRPPSPSPPGDRPSSSESTRPAARSGASR